MPCRRFDHDCRRFGLSPCWLVAVLVVAVLVMCAYLCVHMHRHVWLLRTRYFDLFSGASNLRSLQAAYLKFFEYVDMLVQIIYAKFKNDRTMGILGAQNIKKKF